MKDRPGFWISMAFLIATGLGVTWLFESFDRVTQSKWNPESAAARHDPYLALERWATRLGRPLVRIQHSLELNRLTAGGVLFLDRGRRLLMDAKRVDAILRWVDAGGYLIVVSEVDGASDPLLEPLGVRHWSAPVEASDPLPDPEAESDEDEQPQGGMCRDEGPQRLVVNLPGAARPLRLDAYHVSSDDTVTVDFAPEWAAQKVDAGLALLHFPRGNGQVTVVTTMDWWGNSYIGDQDHAELLWELLQRYQPQGEWRLAERLDGASIWRWLLDHAWMALISLTAWIGLWLWSVVPRFGAILDAPVVERRGLREHLTAMGRAVWREGGTGPLLAALRAAAREVLWRHHPAVMTAEPGERIALVSRHTGLSEEQAWVLLDGEQPLKPAELTDLAKAVQRFAGGPAASR